MNTQSISKAGQEWKASGRYAVRGGNQSPCVAAPVESRPSPDFSRWNVAPCRARNNSRSLPGGATTRAASWHLNDRAFSFAAGLGQRFLAPVVEYALNRVRQVFERLVARQPLSVGFGHLRTGCDQIFLSTLNDGGELIHAGSLPTAHHAFNPLTHQNLSHENFLP